MYLSVPGTSPGTEGIEIMYLNSDEFKIVKIVKEAHFYNFYSVFADMI